MNKNPFAQAAQYQQVTIIAGVAALPAIEAALEDLALSLAHFEQEDGAPARSSTVRSDYAEYYEGRMESVAEIWRTDAVVGDEASRREADLRLMLLKQSGAEIHEIHWQRLEMRDWVSEIQSQFPPLSVGRFYIHGSHVAGLPRPRISLKIDAGCAFGTGEHATTSGCLRALEFLSRTRCPKRILDLGCGTGILALAAQKLWPEAQVTASDMDAVSVRVSQRNAKENAAPGIRFHTAPGLRHRALRQNYDLILANILARPLIHLAGGITEQLAPGGVAILSGLLTTQEGEVLLAYRSRGLRLARAFRHEGWSALVLFKPDSAAGKIAAER